MKQPGKQDFFISTLSLVLACILQIVIMTFIAEKLSSSTPVEPREQTTFSLAQLFKTHETPPITAPTDMTEQQAPSAEIAEKLIKPEPHADEDRQSLAERAIEQPVPGATPELDPEIIPEPEIIPDPKPEPETIPEPEPVKKVAPKAKQVSRQQPLAKPAHPTPSSTELTQRIAAPETTPKPLLSERSVPFQRSTHTSTAAPAPIEPQAKARHLSASEKADLIQNYLTSVFSTIEKNKVYPERARRRNTTGDIEVVFSIAKTGKPQNVSHAKKRRREAQILIEAALDLVKSLEFSQPPEGWDESAQITISISYKLR